MERAQGEITSTWIVYNKYFTQSNASSPNNTAQAQTELNNAHAGLLLGLGLHGHLSSLALTKVFQYLSFEHEISTISILLGLSVTKVTL